MATNGPGSEVRELNAEGQIVWQHFTPDTIMRAVKYPYEILDEPTSCQGDANDDGVVNVNDLLMAIGDWGQTGSLADVNGDGVVSVSDILVMIDAWGTCQ